MRVLRYHYNYDWIVVSGVFTAEDDIAAALLDGANPDHEKRLEELKQATYSMHKSRAYCTDNPVCEPEITNIADITEEMISCGWRENAAD